MNSLEIKEKVEAILKSKGINVSFYVVAADTLTSEVNLNKLPAFVCQNTDLQSQGGTHWLAWYIIDKNTCLFFDSFGKDPSFYKHIQKPTGRVVGQNCVAIQDNKSFTCGQFCIAFIYCLACGLTYFQFLKQFHKNLRYNEMLVLQFVNHINKKM